jgi:hypothetical protein
VFSLVILERAIRGAVVVSQALAASNGYVHRARLRKSRRPYKRVCEIGAFALSVAPPTAKARSYY